MEKSVVLDRAQFQALKDDIENLGKLTRERDFLRAQCRALEGRVGTLTAERDDLKKQLAHRSLR